MDPKKIIITIKRKAFGLLSGCFTNKIGETVGNNDEIKSILICRPNHRLGNLLLLSPLVQELESTFPNSEIDLLVNQSYASQLYQNYENVDQVIAFPRNPFKNPIKSIRAFVQFRSGNAGHRIPFSSEKIEHLPTRHKNLNFKSLTPNIEWLKFSGFGGLNHPAHPILDKKSKNLLFDIPFIPHQQESA
ncbi:hypothetical protein [Flagellimonas hadalis]|uniref:Glycosyltransferase family 9 protein n=1 Tax=Flagellimonas hadalis TaxID=2597517 RepID=A0A5N5IT97_9FLAO|nr:hypothetical protein [Allomuricauda hadalis]KAB5491444.1 glycosyltransferase family 9 protein [Allomuricauda hadalis]